MKFEVFLRVSSCGSQFHSLEPAPKKILSLAQMKFTVVADCLARELESLMGIEVPEALLVILTPGHIVT